MAGGMASAFFFSVVFLWRLWCILTVACIEAAHALFHPQLSVSLSLTLNHCALWGGQCILPLLVHAAELANFLFSLFSLSLGHMSVCLALSHSSVFNMIVFYIQSVHWSYYIILSIQWVHCTRFGKLWELALSDCTLNHSVYSPTVLFIMF